jgi:hypothetical protein
MNSFDPQAKMYTMQGVFYPTGHVFIMVPTAQDALDAERRILDSGYSAGSLCLLTPKDIHEKIAATVEHEEGLPSPGTEAATARHYEELAREGHHGVLIPAPKTSDVEKVMQALHGANISFAQRYRHFVIEDLVA